MIAVLYWKSEFGFFLQRILQNLFPETVYSKVLTKTPAIFKRGWGNCPLAKKEKMALFFSLSN